MVQRSFAAVTCILKNFFFIVILLHAGGIFTIELELEQIQTQMAQKPVLRAEVYARALRASQNVKRAEVWVGARCTLRVTSSKHFELSIVYY